MPLSNYCRKCKAEVPPGESCPYCAAKLSSAGERVSFGVTRLPVKDWFAWNAMLRVALPALALTCAVALGAEGLARGAAGVAALMAQGFLGTMLALLLATLGFVWLTLALQGRESVHFVLDKDGVAAYTYLISPSPARLFARFTSPEAVRRLEADGAALEGYTLVRRAYLPWAQVRRARVWRENLTLLYFRPTFWQALAVRCPVQDFELAERYTRQKLKRYKKTRVVPPQKPAQKQTNP